MGKDRNTDERDNRYDILCDNAYENKDDEEKIVNEMLKS